MPQLDEELLGTGILIAKQSATRNRRVCPVVPAMLAVIEGTVNSGVFDTFATLGLVAPNAAVGVATGAAGVLTGAYSYYVAFFDSNRNVIGVASVQSSTVNPVAQRVTVDLTTITNEAAVPRATHFALYRNLAGTATYLLVTSAITVATASYDDNNSDTSIAANDELQLDNAAPVADTYGWVTTHKSYTFLIGPYNGLGGTTFDDDFTWSKLADPDNYPTVNRTKVEPGRYGPLWCAHSSGDDLIFYKRGAIYMLRFDTGPNGVTGDGVGKTINTERGTVNSFTVINMQGVHLVMDFNGIYEHRGDGNVQEIGLMHLNAIWRRINWTQWPKFSAACDDDLAIWTVALDTDTECNYAFVLDLKAYRARREFRWACFKFQHGMRHMERITVGPDSTAIQFGMQRQRAICAFTEYGYVGHLRAGYTDFVAPQLTARGAVTGGSTSTLVDSAATFSRTNDAGDTESVIGAYITFPNWENIATDKPSSEDWSGRYRITGVSGTTLTVTPNFPVAPPVTTTTYEIGGIEAYVRTPKIGFGMPNAEKEVRRMILEFQPLGYLSSPAGTFDVRWRRDGRGWETNATTRSSSEVTITQTDTFARVNAGGSTVAKTGNGSVPVGGPAGTCKYIEAEIRMDGPNRPAVIDDIVIEVGDVKAGT